MYDLFFPPDNHTTNLQLLPFSVLDLLNQYYVYWEFYSNPTLVFKSVLHLIPSRSRKPYPYYIPPPLHPCSSALPLRQIPPHHNNFLSLGGSHAKRDGAECDTIPPTRSKRYPLHECNGNRTKFFLSIPVSFN